MRDNARHVGDEAGVALGPLRHGDAPGTVFRLGTLSASRPDAGANQVGVSPGTWNMRPVLGQRHERSFHPEGS